MAQPVPQSFNNEIHVNQQHTRWIDRLSTEQYTVLAIAAMVIPTITTIGVIRTYQVYKNYRDINSRVRAAKVFLKSAAAFNPKFFPALLPRIKPGEPLPLTVHGHERLNFPNLANYRELGHGINQYNWRNTDIPAVQRALKRVDNMTSKELWTFTTLYTMMANQAKGYELIEKNMNWVLKGKANLDDVRAANVPEFAKYDLPREHLEMYEKEGWNTAVLPTDRAEAYAQRHEKAQQEYKAKGGTGTFKLYFGNDEYTEKLEESMTKDTKKQQRNV